jgi:hypothetical protein
MIESAPDDVLSILAYLSAPESYSALMRVNKAVYTHLSSHYYKFIRNGFKSAHLHPFADYNAYVAQLNRHILHKISVTHISGYPTFEDVLEHDHLPISVHTVATYMIGTYDLDAPYNVYTAIDLNVNKHCLRQFAEPVTYKHGQLTAEKPTFIWHRSADDERNQRQITILHYLRVYMPELYTYLTDNKWPY